MDSIKIWVELEHKRTGAVVYYEAVVTGGIEEYHTEDIYRNKVVEYEPRIEQIEILVDAPKYKENPRRINVDSLSNWAIITDIDEAVLEGVKNVRESY